MQKDGKLNTIPMMRFFLSLSAVFLVGCGDNLCGEIVTLKKPSPDLSQSLVWVSKDCGATSTPLMSVYMISTDMADVLEIQDPKISKKYRVYAYERGQWDVEWTSKSSILVKYDFTPEFGRVGQFLSKRDMVGEVIVNYQDAAE
jgi:hypothetical protein